MKEIDNFLNEDGQIKSWPAKMDKKKAILLYLSEKFDSGVTYKEKEINEIINAWHTFGDLFILRRGMIDFGYLKRTKDGSRYWKEIDNNQMCETK